METLIGSRVALRALNSGDKESIFALFSDSEAMRYWSYPPYTELSQAEQRLEKDVAGVEKGEWLPWGVALGETLIGTVTLHDLNPEQGRAELGYMLGRKYWGRGLAREAATLAIDHAFGTLGLRRLEADIDPRNVASAKLLERLGFQKEGVLRERWRVGEEISDTALYGLLKRDWEARAR
jgi:[ribosomal protein S5]-alanine N-acetyltransferase